MKKILAVFMVAVFIVSAMSCMVSAVSSATYDQTLAKASQTIQQWQRGWWRRDRTPPTVEILSPADGAIVSGKITINASATDNVGVKTVEYRIDTGTWIGMSYVGDSIYEAEWNTTTVYDGKHTITVKATDTSNNVGEDSITVTTDNGITPPPPTMEYELFIEIDYIGNHEPTQSVLGYIHSYYYERKINVTFYVENVTIAVISLGINYTDGINDDEFWAIEEAVNNLGNDKYGNIDPVFGTAGVYSSKWKWALYGTTVEGASNVVGYIYVVIARVGWTYDLLAGNYIYIADKTADDWATGKRIGPYGAEAVVLMHEMGHSIGIAKLDSRGREVYCSNSECVMSSLSVNNADNYMAWFYCADHWATRNMDYYKVG